MQRDASHWRRYNALRRAFAVMLTLAGAALLADGSGCAAAAGVMESVPARGALGSLATALLGLGLLLLGVRLGRLRTYRPDLGDVSWWAGRAGGYQPGRTRPGPPRSWLTGDPEPPRGDPAT